VPTPRVVRSWRNATQPSVLSRGPRPRCSRTTFPSSQSERVGGEDAFLHVALTADGLELAIQEQVEDLEVAEVPGAPGVELGLERLRRAAGSALRDAPPKDLRVEACDVPGGEAAHVPAGISALSSGVIVRSSSGSVTDTGVAVSRTFGGRRRRTPASVFRVWWL
jgi:hypothetical protein